MTTYLLRQHLRYEYPTPVLHLQHRLMLTPPSWHGAQRRVRNELVVHGAPATLADRLDDFGNHVVDVHAPVVPGAIEFDATVTVERSSGDPDLCLPAAALVDPRYLGPSTLTRPDQAVVEMARKLGRVGKGSLELAERITQQVHAALRYTPGATDVKTTAVEALALGRGVCQDFAHLMLAVSRQCGLPARYVSGHLLGEGGSHAWVEVLLPHPTRARHAVAVPFDPTHDRQAGDRYVTVAVGRDYRDVAPTVGSFRASCRGRLTCRKHLRVAPAPSPQPFWST